MSNPDPVEETKNLPLSQRLEHTHWKVRMVAYEELAKKFAEAEDANSPMFAEYSGILKKIVLDKNAVSLEKGVSVLLAFYDRYEQSPRYTSQLAGLLVEKCLGARQKTKDDATAVMMLMIEVDKESEPVITALIEGAKNKVPKIASASVNVIEQAIKTFGVKAVHVKEILKEFGNWFEHTNADVRAAAIACTVELRRWLGAILDKPVANLREAQQKDLAKLFEEMSKEPAAPTKYRRFEMDAMMAQAAAAAAAGGAAAGQPKEIDEYEMVDAVSIMPKLTPQFYTDLQSKKWKERKEALEAIVAVADHPKIESADYGELTRALKKCFADANVFVVELSIRLIGLLGRGLRKEYSQLGKSCVGGMIEKWKEKKQNVVNAIHEALERMHPHCFSLVDVVEDLEAGSDNKVPSVKSEMLTFIIKMMKESNRAALTKSVKPFVGIFMKLMGDGDPTVREKSFEAFGVLIGVVGERTLQGYIAKLEPIQEKRVREFIPQTPVGLAGPVAAAAAAPAPPAVDASDLAAIAAEVSSSTGAKKAGKAGAAAPASKKTAAPAAAAAAVAPESAVAPASAAKKVGAAAASRSKGSPAKAKTRDSDAGSDDGDSAPTNASNFPLDKEGRADITGRLGGGFLARLDDSDWKKRHEALLAVETILVDANRKIQNKGVFELINALKKRLSDSNKNLVVVALNLLGDLATATGPTITEMMKLIIPNIFNSFTDGKQNVKDAVAVCLDHWVAEVTIDAFFPYFHNAIALPSGKKEILKWISTHVVNATKKSDFKPLIKDVLSCLEDKSKEVRVAAEPLVAEVARRVGIKPIEVEISKLKPASAGPIRQLLSTITSSSAAPAPAASSSSSSAPTAAAGKPGRGSIGAKDKGRFGLPPSAPGTPTKDSSAQESAPQAAAPVPVPQGPVRRNNGKPQREQENLSWSFDEPPVELVAALKQQAQECFSPELLAKMFDSNEAKDHAEALSELEVALEPHKEGVLDSLDVLLKWTSLRLFDTNLAVLRKAVSLFSQLLGLLEIWQVTLSEFEAQSFILIFIERMGVVSHEMVLQAMRGLLKQFNKLYPASKIFKIILHGTLHAQSKLNAQSRAECLKYLGLLIHQQSLNVCTPSEALPMIAHWILDSNVDVAECALETIIEAHRFLEPKDSLWTLLPNLPAGVKALIEKKIQNPTAQVVATSRASAQPTLAASAPASKIPAESARHATPEKRAADPILQGSAHTRKIVENLPKNLFTLELESLPAVNVPKESLEVNLPALTPLPTHLAADFTPSSARGASAEPASEALLAKTPARVAAGWIRDLTSSDGVKAIDAMKSMAVQFKEGTNDDISFFPHVDAITLALANRLLVHMPLPAEPTETFRQLKYMLNTVMLLLAKKHLAKSLSLATVKKLLQALLQPMLEDSLGAKEEGKHLLKVFNVAVLKALDNCERTIAFVSLLQLMRELIPPLDSSVSGKQVYPKMAELVLKCLLKLVKLLNHTVGDLSLDAVMRDLHLFFVSHPALTWEQRVDDVPFATAKTVLDKLVKLKGFDIVQHMGLIPACNTSPKPIIYGYVHQLLRASFPEQCVDEAAVERAVTAENAQLYSDILGVSLHEQMIIVEGAFTITPLTSVAAAPTPEPQIWVPKPASAPQIKEALSVIQKRLLIKESAQQALVDLFCLQRDHPAEFDLASFLAGFSPQFASFIRSSLASMEKIHSGRSTVAPANAQASALVDSYQERLTNLRQKLGLQKPTDTYFAPSVRSLSQLNLGTATMTGAQPPSSPVIARATQIIASGMTALPLSTTSAQTSAPLAATSAPVAISRPATEKTSISALRERLKQAVASDALPSVNIENMAPVTPITPVETPTMTIHADPVPEVAAAQPTTANAGGLAALRERLARIKQSGGQ